MERTKELPKMKFKLWDRFEGKASRQNSLNLKPQTVLADLIALVVF